eukprot:TRINITY_DN625_c0_g1_i1.p1 TRINITY_DN625_c0_g1~~TRINITY_DN625_c0_g1_i1.p1  ORF type:complete len:780 (+),score=334.84 TRINITY_DN625_c0_g1_i1:1-2340(+)
MESQGGSGFGSFFPAGGNQVIRLIVNIGRNKYIFRGDPSSLESLSNLEAAIKKAYNVDYDFELLYFDTDFNQFVAICDFNDFYQALQDQSFKARLIVQRKTEDYFSISDKVLEQLAFACLEKGLDILIEDEQARENQKKGVVMAFSALKQLKHHLTIARNSINRSENLNDSGNSNTTSATAKKRIVIRREKESKESQEKESKDRERKHKEKDREKSKSKSKSKENSDTSTITNNNNNNNNKPQNSVLSQASTINQALASNPVVRPEPISRMPKSFSMMEHLGSGGLSPNNNTTSVQMAIAFNNGITSARPSIPERGDPEARERKRISILNEIMEVETRYVANLDTLVDKLFVSFKQLAEHSTFGVTNDDVATLFSNAETIRNCNTTLKNQLTDVKYKCDSKENSSDKTDSTLSIGNIFLNLAPYLKLYTIYVNNYPSAIQVLEKLKQNSNFISWLKSTEDSSSKSGLSLSDYLIMPVQQVPRYVLLLQDLLKNTESNIKSYEDLEMALKSIKDIATYINDFNKKSEQINKVIKVQNSLVGDCANIVEPSRVWLKEGYLSSFDQYNQIVRYYCFLFNDLFIYAIPERVTSARGIFNLIDNTQKFRFQGLLRLPEFTIINAAEGEIPSLKYGWILKSRDIKMFFGADKEQDKQSWVKILQETIRAVIDSEKITSQSDPILYSQKRGYLKMDGGRFRPWKKRFVVLSEFKLHAYDAETDSMPKITIDLKEGDWILETDSIRMQFKFTKARKSYEFVTENEDDLEEWSQKLNATLQSAIRSKK